jgi:hypothetical protein
MVTPLQDRVFSHERDTVGLSQWSIAQNLVLRELKQKLPELFVLKHQGWSYRKLAREYGYERRTLERQFEKQRKIWAEMSPQTKKEAIVALANAGMSRQGIIEELHVSQRTLYRYLPPERGPNLCEKQDLEPQMTGPVVTHGSPIVEEWACNTWGAAPQARNGELAGHHSKKRLNGTLSRMARKLEPRQLILTFDQPINDEDNLS